VQNLLSNPAIEINVVDVFTRKGYRFKGTAKVFSEGRIFNAVISFYGEAASKYKINHIVLVKVNRVLEITSPIYDTGLSEEEVKIKYIAYWTSVYPK
jgi:predicted pyridoxine 5'-phosphate oxidase superfamily flavin-nucleotide-binding protein